MKRVIVFLSVLTVSWTTFGQTTSPDYNDLKNWESICFCNTNNSLHPQTVVNADNNWQLLYAMRNGLTLKQLDSLKIPYSQSQLLLLRSQRLLNRNQNTYQTAVPVFDKDQTARLRLQSQSAANRIYPQIEQECKDLVAYLSLQNRSNNAFSILFSYVLDGLIWKRFEKEEMTEERKAAGVWSGSYWFLTPKRAFQCGTNSLSNPDGIAFSWNWSYVEFEKLSGGLGRFNQEYNALFQAATEGSKVSDPTAIAAFFCVWLF